MARMCSLCRRPALPGRTRCAKHLVANFYTPKKKKPRKNPAVRRTSQVRRHRDWPRISKQYLSTHPWCARCARNGKPFVRAKHTDHIFPVRLFPDRELDESNWQGLCEKCHAKKTGHERGRLLMDYRRGKIYDVGSMLN